MRRKFRSIPVLPEGLEARPRIDGQKLIAEYMKITVLQLYRIRKVTANSDDPCPVFPMNPGMAPNARLSAYVDELDAWMDRRSQAMHHRPRS
jgi:hypothetical protein